MDYLKYYNKMKILESKYYQLKDYINSNNQKNIIKRLSNDSNYNCLIKCCPKKATYIYNDNYYCWFHKLEIKN